MLIRRTTSSMTGTIGRSWFRIATSHSFRQFANGFVCPEVVTLAEFDRLPSAAVTFSRRNVFKRDRFTCQYCNKQPGSDELTIDHVVPRALGGESTWTNCVMACWECNTHKADRSPKQAKMRLGKEPVRPTWKPLYSEHASRMESWSKFISEAYWNAELRS